MQVVGTIIDILWTYVVSGVMLYVFSVVSTKDKVDILTWPKYVFKPRKPQPTLNKEDIEFVRSLAESAVNDYKLEQAKKLYEVALSKRDKELLDRACSAPVRAEPF